MTKTKHISKSRSAPRIYLSSPHMEGEVLELVQEAFASDWIAPLGPHVDGVERELARYVWDAACRRVRDGLSIFR